MPGHVLDHFLEQISAAPVISFPYHHFHIEQIFQESFYEQLLCHLPDVSYFDQLELYPKRHYLNFGKELEHLPFPLFLFWKQLATHLYSDEMISALLEKFQPQLKRRFGNTFSKAKLAVDVALIRDQSNFSIGPHTDHPNKVISLLFYLPSSLDQSHLGTSLYLPKDRSFLCDGLKHHPFKDFDKVHTVPFIPNSLFGFARSDISFHGVEPTGQQEKERILISYTIWEQNDFNKNF